MELIVIPIVASLLARLAGDRYAKWVALIASFVSAFVTVWLLSRFNANGSWNFQVNYPWFSESIRFNIGVDGISMILLILANILMPVIILTTWDRNIERPSIFYALVLLMHGAMNGVFIAKDGLLFYLFWELALIPIYFIVGMWGGENRVKVSLKFFIYTFLGSLFMLASLFFLHAKTGWKSFDIEALYQINLTRSEAIWVGAGFLLAFAVKIPIFPFHTWQPSTYTTAPSAGTMLLSGIMLKMGLYGMIRWYLPMATESLDFYIPIILVLSVIGILYGGLIAIRQNHIKTLIAYSSISHVGLIVAGLATASVAGIQGGLYQMLTHGVNAVGLFFAAEIILRKTGKVNLTEMGGFAKSSPAFATMFLIIVLGTVAVPFSNGFPGEFLLLKSTFDYKPILGVLAATTIIWCAVYMLRAYQFSMLGKPANAAVQMSDLSPSEWLAFSILVILVVAGGLFPQAMMDISAASVNKLVENLSVVNLKTL